MCSLQIKYGAKFLPNVCKDYPRVYNFINSHLEKSIDISCPTAAKLVLLNKEGIKFQEKPMKEIYEIQARNCNFDENDVYKYINDIRTFCIQIMKSRDYEIWERFIILGLFLQEISNLSLNSSDESLKIIDKFTNLIVSGEMKDALKSIPSNLDIKLKLIKRIMDDRIIFDKQNNVNEKYKEMFIKSIYSLGYVKNYKFEDVKNNYINFYEKYVKQYMKENSYIFENFIVNAMFSDVFPFLNVEENFIWNNYVLFIVSYSILEMLLVGLLGYSDGKFTNEDVINLISKYYIKYFHNEGFRRYIIELLNDKEFNSMAYMSILVKSN